MPTRIGPFEILSDLSKSPTGAVYKALDPRTNETVALKVIALAAFRDCSSDVEACLLEEAGSTRALSHPNLIAVYGAGEIEGQFCAAMEYIQGNSVATMVARKEGFSIWDLLDIGRQVCGGLDYAHSKGVFHYSLEPAKIMCGWDGTTRILSFGVSSVGKFAAQMPGLPAILHYMSPEQVRGGIIDARSNIFSLGAILYEMVTDRKAFDREDAESLRRSLLESTPVPAMHVNRKLHPLLSDLIMKALAKDPGERYQSGRELLEDLEKCKDSKPQAGKGAAAARAASGSSPARAVGQAKLASPAASPLEQRPPHRDASLAPQPIAPQPIAPQSITPSPSATETPVRTAALARSENTRTPAAPASGPGAATSAPSQQARSISLLSASMSSAVDKPEDALQFETFTSSPAGIPDGASKAGGPSSQRRPSFSDVTALPPLKEMYVGAPSPSHAAQQAPLQPPHLPPAPRREIPQGRPREAAKKALKQVRNVPANLMVYAIAAAAILILVMAIVLILHINRLNRDADSLGPASLPAPAASSAPPASEAIAPSEAEPAALQPEPSPRAASSGRSAKKKSPAAPVVIPGQMSIDSTPQGAQVQIDGKADSAWITPFTLSGLSPGQHTVTVSKAGYSPDTRAVEVIAGSKSFVVTHLNQLMATLSVNSTPPGASVYIDGRDSGKLTPAQLSVDRGQHTVLVRKSGFLDETITAQFVLAQTVSFSPTLRPLGNVDDIRTVNRLKKLFGGREAQGMGTISVRTQPKGAQVAINQHVMDKLSPIDLMLDPGNYIVDVTLTGYIPIHKEITVEKGSKTAIDEVMQHD